MIYDKPQAITFPFFHLNPDKNLGSSSLERKNRISFETLLRNSGLFDLSHRFSTLNNRIHVVGNSSTKVDEIVKHANETHPMIHGKVQKIIVQFLEEKRVNGTKIEKEVYKTITPLQFVDRLLKMRPLVFMTKHDKFMLRDCSNGD